MSEHIVPSVVPVTGPPGAGKSSALIALQRQSADLARMGVRDYGLYLAARNDPLGLAMRDTLQRQELLTNDLVRAEFLHFIDNVPNTVQVVAVEGYPRDTAQCADLVGAVRERGTWVAAFVVVDIPDDVVRERAAQRQLCVHCGAPTSRPAVVTCPDCGGPVVRRRDDEPGALARRLADYREVSKGPRDYFGERGLLHVVDGLLPADEVQTELAALLGIVEHALPMTRTDAR